MLPRRKAIDLSLSASLAVMFVLLWSFAVPAKEVKFPTPSYEGEELAKVKEWESTWVGKKVSTAEVDQVKDLLPEAVYTIMKNPKDFGAEGDMWFEVVPYREYKASPGLIESTKQHAPQAQFDAKLNLLNYGKVAGIPFPQLDTADPVMAGTQAAWNFDGFTHGDGSYLNNEPANIVDCRTRLERSAGQIRWMMFWSGRSDIAPKPELPNNQRKVHRTFFQRNTAPPDFADTTILEVKYQDTSRDCDLYVYTAMFRRIRRYTTSQRSDMIDGTDLIYDDNNGWYTHININKYKLIGQKDMLVARHVEDPKKLSRITGQGFWNGVPRERTKCWVVEAVNRDPDYIYSKRIWYLDPENWQMNVQEMYDRQGKLWKLQEQFYNEYKLVEAEGMATYVNSEHTVDLIRRHGSVGQYEIYKVGTTLDEKIFSVANLQQLSY
jgi:hypothetical protein